MDGRTRAVIERITPQVDCGRFPIKRTVGETVIVAADVFGDGHDVVVAAIRYRYLPTTQSPGDWVEVPMQPLVNDRWQSQFTVTEMGEYEYTVVAWVDRFLTWHRDFLKRAAANQVARVDLQIGADLVAEAVAHANPDERERLQDWERRLRADTALSDVPELVDASELETLLRRYPSRAFLNVYEPALRVRVDRERARFSSWYELFPRSAADKPGQHGTLRDVQARLPYVAAMGFDVLYLPPIHPIGHNFRKGKNNATEAQPDDVGSPWAIGAPTGGHKAILPELGTLDDFRDLVAAARQHQIEIALDIAFQCAPDHPYVQEHPEWFRARPDGTIQYAENPPKKYQDIYPFDFETDNWEGLRQELKSVFEFWIEQGVYIFRVDNPHTKPFSFWEWCIGELKQKYPEVLFLSEAFTRPKVMYRLAKLGFTQSYTYFSWRNTKAELTEYLTELTQTEAKDFFRPNFWPNTPDILTEYLQIGGRPAFQTRLVLAAMLCSNYGIYGPPFEHCWNAPRHAGSEEYLDSEKYQIHYHQLDRPDSLKDLIARVNQIRREFPMLQSNDSLQFHAVDNESLICFSKSAADRSQVILTVVNLDPHNIQTGFVTLPLVDLGLDAEAPYQVHDLLSHARYLWHGERNYVALDPRIIPAHIFLIRKRLRTEQDFEYFL